MDKESYMGPLAITSVDHTPDTVKITFASGDYTVVSRDGWRSFFPEDYKNHGTEQADGSQYYVLPAGTKIRYFGIEGVADAMVVEYKKDTREERLSFIVDANLYPCLHSVIGEGFFFKPGKSVYTVVQSTWGPSSFGLYPLSKS